jgi:hypothetical protein
LGYGPDNVTNPSSSSNTPIAKSVAVKFDLYNNAGEGVDSTGSYTNGASPTTPALDMTSSGVNLHSGDVFNVHVTYDGTTLTWTITDATTGKTFTASAAVNIPSLVGGNTAFVGFTAGTGGSTATQEIITWTLTSGSSSAIQYETESPTVFNASKSSGPTYRVFAWSGFTDGSGTTLDATAAGQSVTITLNVAQAGTYDVKYATKAHSTRGIVQLTVNGANVGPAEDQYSAADTWKEFDLGNVTLAAGKSILCIYYHRQEPCQQRFYAGLRLHQTDTAITGVRNAGRAPQRGRRIQARSPLFCDKLASSDLFERISRDAVEKYQEPPSNRGISPRRLRPPNCKALLN